MYSLKPKLDSISDVNQSVIDNIVFDLSEILLEPAKDTEMLKPETGKLNQTCTIEHSE